MAVEWLEGKSGMLPRGAALRHLLEEQKGVAVAGAWDGMSALLAKAAGFPALYLSGAALSASKALPDLGLLTVEDVTRATHDLVRASDLPVIVDCDTGFGEALNVMRTVRDLEGVGAACIQIEDQRFPKKCGHLNDKQLISADDMCRKVEAARRASSDILICARTDAADISIEDAIERANRYCNAGADIIFVEALTSEETIRQVRGEVKAPLLANMTEFGRTPQIGLSEWRELGFDLVIYPVSAFRVATRSMQNFYRSLRENGHAGDFLESMMTRAELYETINYYDYEELDTLIARTVLQET